MCEVYSSSEIPKISGGFLTEGAYEELLEKQDQLLEDMKNAIADGVLSQQDKNYISAKTEELRESILTKGILSDEEERILRKIQTTYDLIMKIEKEYLNQYINYLRKR
jgi:hypothetical protein